MPPVSVPGRVLVTGASGFLASHLSRTLLERGHAVVGTGKQQFILTSSLVVLSLIATLVRSHAKACFHPTSSSEPR
jgi:nucleoside-diphosphate-sugar epimerase